MAQREYPRQPRRPIRRIAPAATPAATHGSLALSDPVMASNPYASGAQIYPTGATGAGSNSNNASQAWRNPNPPVDEMSSTVPNLKSYGATGTSFFGGIIQSDEYNPEFGWRDAVIKYEQMSRNDAQIMAIKQQVEQPILAAKWSIEPASDSAIDTEIASFVQSCLFDDMCYTTTDGTQVYQSWQETLRQILMYKWYGFMLLEKCFRIEDGWVKWSRFLPLLPRTVWRWYVGADNELESVEQWAYKEWTYQYNRIPRGKLLHFASRMEGQNYQGISVLRSAFANWWYKQQFLKIAAIEIERNAIIPPVIQMGPNPSADEVSAALKLAQNIRANEQLGVVIGHDMHFEYPRMTERGAAQILPLIEYHDNMIARNILGQFINLGSHEVGSYALAQQQVTNFLNTLQSECTYVCDVINHSAIRQLVDYNYDGVAVYPKLVCSRLVAQDITTLSTALQFLGSYVPPSPEVNDAIADALGLPKPPQSMVESTNPTSPTNPQRPDNARANDHTTDEGDGTAAGHSSGTGGGRDGTADYQDTYDNGGAGDGVGMSENASESQSLREFRLLRESLDAFNAQFDGDGDAVERSVSYLLGGHAPGYDQNRDAHGHWATGDGGSGEHEGKGTGRGRGGKGSGAASGKGKGEHEATGGKSSGTRSRGGAGSSGKSAKAEKTGKTARGKSKFGPIDTPEHRVQEARVGLKSAHDLLKQVNDPNYHMPEEHRTAARARIQQLVHEREQELASAEHALKSASKAEASTTHATKSSGGAKAAKGAKTPEEQHAEKLGKAQAKVHGLEQELRQKRDEQRAERERTGQILPMAGHTVETQLALGRAQEAQARLEGRKLHPAEKGITREDFLAGKGSYMKGFTTINVSPAEAKAYLEHPTLRTAKSAEKSVAKSVEKAPRGAKKTPEPAKQLVPIRPVEPGSIYISAAREINPYGLAHVFGMHQLRQALEGHSLERLQGAAKLVQQHYPGTKPSRMNSKKSVIDYIHEYVGRNPDAGSKGI